MCVFVCDNVIVRFFSHLVTVLLWSAATLIYCMCFLHRFRLDEHVSLAFMLEDNTETSK